MGKLPNEYQVSKITSLLISQTFSLETAVTKFWEVQNVTTAKPHEIIDDVICEQHFCDAVYSNKHGRYIVSLLFKSKPPIFVDFKNNAVNRFLKLEISFKRYRYFF